MPSTDLAQAVLVRLRASAVVTTAFGDTWIPDPTLPAGGTGVMKFFFDWAGQPDEPYLAAIESWETYEFMTRTVNLATVDYIATGQIQVLLYQSDRKAARQLGVLVAAALNDQEANITWTGSTLINFRIARAEFASITVTGPNVPIAFNRVLTFDYSYESSLTEP